MRRFHCQTCGHEVFFDNTVCVSCSSRLGYVPERVRMLSAPPGDDLWSDGNGRHYRACGNAPLVACNWLVPADAADALCLACRHNRVIPNLDDVEAVVRWSRLELAKRALFYSLIRWRLPMPTKHEAPEAGLAFDFLADEALPDGTVKTHLTGHADGVITLNIAEGDDAERERRRTEMGEPYRTLVGHFRHEIGHYYWDRLVRDGGRLAACRAVFGDERADYGEALRRHYAEGPPADWGDRTISAYAASHPWEDFAETFAHYLHIVDALETAHAFGVQRVAEDGTISVDADPYQAGTLAALIAAWVPVTVALNAINRSMGQPDLYPFVLSPAVEEKLGFVHDLVRGR
jgi:hypothetical protein